MNLDSGLLNHQIGNLGLKVISKHYQSVSTLVLPWWLSGKEATCMTFSVLIAIVSLNMGCVHKHGYEGQKRQNVLKVTCAQSELSVNAVIITRILASTHTACSLITLTCKAISNPSSTKPFNSSPP